MTFTLTGVPLPLSFRPAVALSDEDLMRLSEENRPCKIERNRDGEITVMTPVGGIGSTHEIFVASSLYLWAEGDGGGLAFGSNAGFNLPDGSCLSPDAAWLSRVRWDGLSVEEQAGYPPLCPEFVIEVRSRTDSRRLLEGKMSLWLENGAELAWLIDPMDGNVTVYQPGVVAEMLVRPEVVAGMGPVATFVLRASRLWGAR